MGSIGRASRWLREAAQPQSLPEDPARKEDPVGRGTLQSLPLLTGLSGKATAWVGYWGDWSRSWEELRGAGVCKSCL